MAALRAFEKVQDCDLNLRLPEDDVVDAGLAQQLVDAGAEELAGCLMPVVDPVIMQHPSELLRLIIHAACTSLLTVQDEHAKPHGEHGLSLQHNVAICTHKPGSAVVVKYCQWRNYPPLREWQTLAVDQKLHTLKFSVFSMNPFVKQSELKDFRVLVPNIDMRVVKSPLFREPITQGGRELYRMWEAVYHNRDAVRTPDAECHKCGTMLDHVGNELTTCALCGSSLHATCTAEVSRMAYLGGKA